MMLVNPLFKMFCKLLEGAVSQKPPFDAAIFRSAIIDGKSIAPAAQAAAEVASYGVAVHLYIENYGIWPLTNPKTVMNKGKMRYPPQAVLPGEREAMVMHKTAWAAEGCYGTVSWLLEGRRRAVVMWSAPFNHNFHSNYLAVGILNDTNNKATADDMYYKSGSFERGEYYKSTQSIRHCDPAFCIQGAMGTSHHPSIRISVYPTDPTNYASNVQKYLDDPRVDTVFG